MIFEDDSPKEECGVIGIFAPNEDVARMAFFGLYALQHRGQEAAGIAVAELSCVPPGRDHSRIGFRWLRPAALPPAKFHRPSGTGR